MKEGKKRIIICCVKYLQFPYSYSHLGEVETFKNEKKLSDKGATRVRTWVSGMSKYLQNPE